MHRKCSDTAYVESAPAHHTTLVFTRNVVGPMDYTPVIFTSKRTPRVTTDAHEVALSVMFESGLQHFADLQVSFLPDDARNLPDLDGIPGVARVERRLLFPGTVRIPGRAWYLPDGTNMERHGAVPDLVVPQTPEDEVKNEDAQLKAAVEDLMKRVK